MWKNITLTIGFLLIWGWVGGFDWAYDTVECINIEYSSHLIDEINCASNTILRLMGEVNGKDLVISNYKKEILEWTTKYTSIQEQLDLTKHSLEMANKALNSITEGINDSSDYE